MPKKLRHKLAQLTNTKKDLVWREVHCRKRRGLAGIKRVCMYVCALVDKKIAVHKSSTEGTAKKLL